MRVRQSYEVRIHVYSGKLENTRRIVKPGWTGQGLVFSRSVLTSVLRQFKLTESGVYVLWNDATVDQQPSIYIGSSGTLNERLQVQANSVKLSWSRGVVFTSQGKILNNAHFKHLEAKLVELAKESRRCNPINKNDPRPPALSESDISLAESYLDEMLLCLPFVGIDVFGEPPKPEIKELFLNSKGITARCYIDGERFVVRAGSLAVTEEVGSISRSLSELRRQLIEKDQILEASGDKYKFTKDHPFASPSTAAGVLLGGRTNGNRAWKDKNGRPLKDFRRKEP